MNRCPRILSPHHCAIAALALATLFASCDPGRDQVAPGTGDPVADASAWLPLEAGGVPFRAQFAIRPSEQRRGLMLREELGEHDGMLFVYNEPQPMAFWMRDTPLPLDIGFFTPDGVLQEIHRLMPFDETIVRARHERLQFALEMNQGWFARNGIRPGDQLDLDLLAEGIRARGFDPSQYLGHTD